MDQFMLGRETLLDSNSAEYFWVNWMCGENYSKEKIIRHIIKAFGGDEEIASSMINVARGKHTKTSLITLIESKKLVEKSNATDKPYPN